MSASENDRLPEIVTLELVDKAAPRRDAADREREPAHTPELGAGDAQAGPPAVRA